VITTEIDTELAPAPPGCRDEKSREMFVGALDQDVEARSRQVTHGAVGCQTQIEIAIGEGVDIACRSVRDARSDERGSASEAEAKVSQRREQNRSDAPLFAR